MERPQSDTGLIRAIETASPELRDLRDLARKMLLSRDPKEICRLLGDSIPRLLKAPRAAVFLADPASGALPPPSDADAALHPDKEIVDFAFQGGRPPVLPNSAGTLLIVFPLRVQNQRVGVVSVDITGVAEEVLRANLDPVDALLDPGAVALVNVQTMHRSVGESAILSNILDSIPNGIVTIDNDRRITRLNRNAMAMLELAPDCVGSAYQEVFPPKITEALDDLIRETAEMGFAMEKVISHKLAQGSELHFALSMSVLCDENYSPLGMIVVFRDMTATRELDRLRRLDTMKSEFVANVSHELKTPLTSIKAYTEALLDMVEEEQMKQFLKVIDEESDRLLFLINDLLNVSRIQSGKMKMHFELCDPRQAVTEVLNISKVQSAMHQIHLELAEDVPAMMVDLDKMKEVMINLLSNAIKYSPNGGGVWVRMRREEANLRIEVQDEGMGIPRENLPKLFQAFYRVDSSLTSEIPGTGLGLVIVKAIVEHHGGRIWLDSEPGKGTTFFILIPVRREAPQQPAGFAE
ncbi:MAG: PAS domain-containing protein [Planctomycetes bacterium]|nr:PAS domain-containing protein [Planctomycetota bacterium]